MAKRIIAAILAAALTVSVLSIFAFAVPAPMAPVGGFSVAVSIGSSTAHGMIIRGALIPMPHTFSGDTCRFCGYTRPKTDDNSAIIEEEEPEEEKPTKKTLTYTPSEDAVYVMTKTGGQDFEDLAIDGTGLDLVTSDGRTRLATSWVGNGEVYNALVDALNANPDGIIKVTYTGNITAFGIESEAAGIIDIETEADESDDFKKFTVSVKAFLEAGKSALDDTSWRNIYVVADDGAKLYGFEILP